MNGSTWHDDAGVGQRSQRRRKPYTRESIGCALQHHGHAGVVTFVSPPEQGRPTWRVGLAGQPEPLELSHAAAYALCVGMAAAEHVHRVTP